METLNFHKLQSAGNDFIFIFNNDNYQFTKNSIKKICNRNFGIGGDGLFIVNKNNIKHYDPDGTESFCANGSLCLSYLKKLGFPISSNFKIFNTIVNSNNTENSIQINFNIPKLEIKNYEFENNDCLYVEIGNPHLFIEKEIIDYEELNNLGILYKNIPMFPNGINISFIKKIENCVFEIATFERGVFQITKCCGSACCAYAIYLYKKESKNNEITFIPPSNIKRYVKVNNNQISLKGSVNYVYKGSFNIADFDISSKLNK